MTKQDFVKRFAGPVSAVTAGTGIFMETLLAQIALETGWARSPHSHPSVNNFVGAKAGSSWAGKVISSTTKESINGVMNTYKGTGKIYANKAAALADGAHPYTIFRVFPNEQAGLQGYIDVLRGNPNYAAKGVFTAKDPIEQVKALKAAGYATDPNYVAKLTSIINGLVPILQQWATTATASTGGKALLGLVAGLVLYKIFI